MDDVMSKTDLFLEMSTPYLAFSMLAAIIAILAIFAIGVSEKPLPVDSAKRRLRAKLAVTGVAVICLAWSAYATDTVLTAIRHGAYDTDMGIVEMRRRIPLTPEETPVQDESELSDCLLVYFRFGCPDCEAVHADLSKTLDDAERVYYISTRSRQGAALMERFPVDEVPCVVYVYPDGASFAKSVPYRRDASGHAVFDESRVRDLLAIRERERSE